LNFIVAFEVLEVVVVDVFASFRDDASKNGVAFINRLDWFAELFV